MVLHSCMRWEVGCIAMATESLKCAGSWFAGAGFDGCAFQNREFDCNGPLSRLRNMHFRCAPSATATRDRGPLQSNSRLRSAVSGYLCPISDSPQHDWSLSLWRLSPGRRVRVRSCTKCTKLHGCVSPERKPKSALGTHARVTRRERCFWMAACMSSASLVAVDRRFSTRSLSDAPTVSLSSSRSSSSFVSISASGVPS